MASNIKIAVAARNAMGDALITALGSSPVIQVYTGTQPAGPGTAITSQVLLGTLACSATPAPATSSGVITFNAITQDSSADASGTAAWYRLCKSDLTAIVDGTVGTSGADLNLNTVTIVAAGPIACTSFTYTMPGG